MKNTDNTFSEGLKTWKDFKHSLSKKDFEKCLKYKAGQLEKASYRHPLDSLNIFFKPSTDMLLFYLLNNIISVLYFKKMHKEIENLITKYTL